MRASAFDRHLTFTRVGISPLSGGVTFCRLDLRWYAANAMAKMTITPTNAPTTSMFTAAAEPAPPSVVIKRDGELVRIGAGAGALVGIGAACDGDRTTPGVGQDAGGRVGAAEGGRPVGEWEDAGGRVGAGAGGPVGVADGECVAVWEGAALEPEVGIAVGVCEGVDPEVGIAVGISEGGREGDLLGGGVGACVGALVGTTDGDGTGTVVGTADGAGVGGVVGAGVGCAVGVSVGAGVG